MKPRTPRRVTRAMKSVVVVSHTKGDGHYSAGFIAVSNAKAETLVVAPESFVRGQKHVNVSFFDGHLSRAQVVSSLGFFSLLSTELHTGCEEVRFIEPTSPLLTPSRTFMLPPVSAASIYHLPSFANVESVASYLLDDYRIMAADSDNYFLVSCDYVGRKYNAASRLRGAPVFTMTNTTTDEGSTMGVVLDDWGRPGSDIRVAITATHFKEIVQGLVALAGKELPPRWKQSEPNSEDQVEKDSPTPLSPPSRKGRKQSEHNRQEEVQKDPPKPRRKRSKQSEHNRQEEVEEDTPSLPRRKQSKRSEHNRQEEVEEDTPSLPRRKRRKTKRVNN